MMQSAPIRRAAATVFNRCWATSVSTVGTPVMSMIAMVAPVSTILCRRLSITTWVRSLSNVPMSGSARMLSHSSTTGVDSSSSSRCWLWMTDSRLLRKISVVYSAMRSRTVVVVHSSSPSALASFASSVRIRPNSTCFNERMKVAVSVELNPCCARERETPSRNSRTAAQLGLSMRSKSPLSSAVRNSPRNSCDCARSSPSFIRSARSDEADSCACIHSASRSFWYLTSTVRTVWPAAGGIGCLRVGAVGRAVDVLLGAEAYQKVGRCAARDRFQASASVASRRNAAPAL